MEFCERTRKKVSHINDNMFMMRKFVNIYGYMCHLFKYNEKS